MSVDVGSEDNDDEMTISFIKKVEWVTNVDKNERVRLTDLFSCFLSESTELSDLVTHTNWGFISSSCTLWGWSYNNNMSVIKI